ncbi:MAG TPA: hypothetical protein VHB45_12215 [Alloacidobacterium sp.]|nr:hypothetical protein [Alloacidobacterium sp.]
MRKIFSAAGAALLSGFMAHAQSTSAKVDHYSAQDIRKQLAELAPKAKDSGSSGSTLGDYANHQIKLSLRATSGGSESHAHFVDIFFVTQGKATLITGGTIENPKSIGDGETQGSGIQGGHAETISVGDVVHIPAGTPHQIKVENGTIYSAIVIKVKQ